MTKEIVSDFQKVINSKSLLAYKEGFNMPLSITNQVWSDYIHWTDEDSSRQKIAQVTDERLREVLHKLQLAINSTPESECIVYEILAVPRDGKSKTPQRIQLLATIDY